MLFAWLILGDARGSTFDACVTYVAQPPLLRQPWTASATSRQQTEQDKAEKLGLIRLLRNDLEKVRMLTELVRKREKKKLERANHLKKVVEGLLFPKEDAMRQVLQAVKRYVRSMSYLSLSLSPNDSRLRFANSSAPLRTAHTASTSPATLLSLSVASRCRTITTSSSSPWTGRP